MPVRLIQPRFTYEEALALQIEGCLAQMEQANSELSTVLERAHKYLLELAQKKGREGPRLGDEEPRLNFETTRRDD